MKQSYDLCLAKVLQYEGGYVNHPKDPGGATNKGITQATYNSWRTRMGLPVQSVRNIANSEVAAIYRNDYWDRLKCDDLPVGVDLAVFDFGVNSGISRSAKVLQSLVGVPSDGLIGPRTLRAASANQVGLVDKICDARLRFLRSLKTWSTFGKGWGSRVESVRGVAKNMRKTYSEIVSNT